MIKSSFVLYCVFSQSSGVNIPYQPLSKVKNHKILNEKSQNYVRRNRKNVCGAVVASFMKPQVPGTVL